MYNHVEAGRFSFQASANKDSENIISTDVTRNHRQHFQCPLIPVEKDAGKS